MLSYIYIHNNKKRLIGVHCIGAVDRKVGSLFGCAQRLLGDGLAARLQRSMVQESKRPINDPGVVFVIVNVIWVGVGPLPWL